MKVLGCDPSLTNFGWALHDTDGAGPGRCLERGRFKTSSKTLFVERYCEMRANVAGLVKRVGVSRVGVEYPIFNDLWSEGMYGLFLYTCEALRAAQVDVVFFSPGQVKGHARDLPVTTIDPGSGISSTGPFRPGNWKMEKPDMVEAARADTGGKGNWNHNEADAYWVARTAGRFWLFHDGLLTVDDLTARERKQFADVRTIERGARAGTVEKKGILYREDERFFLWAKEKTKLDYASWQGGLLEDEENGDHEES